MSSRNWYYKSNLVFPLLFIRVLLLYFHIMKESQFSVFVRLASIGLFSLYVLYFLIDYHLNVLVWFSMQEWFMNAWELIVLIAIILSFDLDDDRLKKEQEQTIKTFPLIDIDLSEYYKIPVHTQWKHIVKRNPLTQEHRNNISKALKEKNHHKKLVKQVQQK